jgi:hypothetical protein
MSGLRSFLASTGIALAGVGLLIVFAPDVAGALSLPRVAVIGVGVFGLVEAARALQLRRRTEIDGAELPEPEAREETAWPGDGFDRRVAAVGRKRDRSWAGGQHERLRRRLQDAAVDAAAHRWRLRTSEARDRIETGDWTEDPAAAWFLGGETVEPPPWSIRLRAYLDGPTPFAYYANRTADAVVELREAS